MNKLTITLMAMLIVVSFPNITHAATSNVAWIEHEKFRDIDPSNEGRKHFRERIFYNIEKHFTKLAKKLPEGQVLNIKVTDVDLAGDTHIGGISEIRIIKNLYFPRINFFYTLVDADGNTITSDDVVLKDMNFMQGSFLRYRNESLGYEKKMLDDWFSKTFQ